MASCLKIWPATPQFLSKKISLEGIFIVIEMYLEVSLCKKFRLLLCIIYVRIASRWPESLGFLLSFIVKLG